MIYKIVFGANITELNNTVIVHIKLGLLPQGGVACQENILYQALVKTQ